MKDTSREENGSSKVDRILVSFTLFIPFSYRPVTVPPGGMEGEEMNRVNHARLCRSVPVTHILTLSLHFTSPSVRFVPEQNVKGKNRTER